MTNISKGDIVLYKKKLYVANEIVKTRIKLFWLDEPRFFWTNLSDVKLYEKRSDSISSFNITNIPNRDFTRTPDCEECGGHNLIAGLVCPENSKIIH
jgi:hypothetical protein